MKPMLFNTERVRAILDGGKSVTRRVVKPQPLWIKPPIQQRNHSEYWANWDDERIYRAPYRPGDILSVRETFYKDAGRYMYKANYSDSEKFYRDGREVSIKWHPSIHMPREAARIFLRVTDVRVERLQDIDGRSVLSEGVDNGHSNPQMGRRWENMQRMAFSEVWNSCYAKPRPVKGADGSIDHYKSYPWEDIQETRTYRGNLWYVIGNPWVWVIEFERCERPEEAE